MGQAACLDFSSDILSWRKVEKQNQLGQENALEKKYFTAAAAGVNQSSTFLFMPAGDLVQKPGRRLPSPNGAASFLLLFFFIQVLDTLSSLP